MCKKEVLSLPVGDTHGLTTLYAVYAAPHDKKPLNQRGEAETSYYAFRQGRQQGQPGQMNEVYTLAYALLLDPMSALQPQLKAQGVTLSGSELKALAAYMQAASMLEPRYKATQWFHILRKHCVLAHKPQPGIRNHENAMYFPLDVICRHRRPIPC